MLRKTAWLSSFTSFRRADNALQRRGLSRKAQSMLEALLPEVKPRDKPKQRSFPIRRPPSKGKKPSLSAQREQPATGSLSFFSEVEDFLDKEKTSSKGNPSDEFVWGSATKPGAADEIKPAAISYVPKKSIFDVFKVPEPPARRSENAFDAEAYAAYETILGAFFSESGPSPVEKQRAALTKEQQERVEVWIHLDVPALQQLQLPTLMAVCDRGVENMRNEPSDKSLKDQVKDELANQSQTFQKELEWTKEEYKYATRLIHAITHYSHQNHKALPILIAWEKMKEAGYLRQKTIEICLQSATSFSGGILSRNRSSLLTLSPRNRLLDMLDSKDPKRQADGKPDNQHDQLSSNVPEQLATVNDLLFNPTEQSSAIRIRRLISLGDASNALNLIEDRMTGEARLRAYSQVFGLFLELGDISEALFLLKKMKRGHKQVPLQPELFVQLIAATAEMGYFCHGSDPIENVRQLGFSESGPRLFNQLATEMSLYVDSISSASAKRLHKAFTRGFSDGGSVDEFDHSALAPLKALIEPVAESTLMADRVCIDTSSGYCGSSGVRLRLLDLKKDQKNQMKQGLLRLGGERHGNLMESFWDWLNSRTGRPFTVIVDGANIAYYMQNFDKGRFNFHQIEFVVSALESHGEHPLVILPHKYLKDSFHATLGASSTVQTLSAGDRSIIDGLKDAGGLYAVPQGCLDDYFWILATVSDQVKCQRDDAQEQKSASSKRLSSGPYPVVITNDQIRDHKEFELLETKAFNRWYSNTIVNFSFTGFVDDKCVDPDLFFTPADKFSREIQSNKKTGTWHFPVQDWETSDWFCIRIPSPMKD